MKEGESVELAKRIYSSHKEALDFIFENKSDRTSEIANIVEKILSEKGYDLGSQGKGITRFLTKKLKELPMPNTGTGEGRWKLKESFLFEIKYGTAVKSKEIILQATIAPGDRKIREILRNAIENTQGAKKIEDIKAKWLTYFKKV
ncbi:hypothetical protein, partial [Clostridium sp.]